MQTGIPLICNSCETYKILYGFERKKKHLPVEPNLFEVRSANNRSPSSYCPTCNLYMALYATIRWRKRGAYGKISKNSYYRYKKMPKEARPPFYVKKCRGEFIKDEYGTHFYEVEELTSHNPFKKYTRRSTRKTSTWDKPNLIPSHVLNSALRCIYTDITPLYPKRETPSRTELSYESPPLEQLLPIFEPSACDSSSF